MIPILGISDLHLVGEHILASPKRGLKSTGICDIKYHKVLYEAQEMSTLLCLNGEKFEILEILIVFIEVKFSYQFPIRFSSMKFGIGCCLQLPLYISVAMNILSL